MTLPRVLITGAEGFVGQALVSGFTRAGWRVVALDRAPTDTVMTRTMGGSMETWPGTDSTDSVEQVYADLSFGVPDSVPSVDLVVHGAWITTDPDRMGVSGPQYLRMNLDPLDAALRYAVTHRPRAFVFLSSSGVFSPADATHQLTDTHVPSASGPYATSKRAGETLVAESLGECTRVYVVRLGYLFGPGESLRPSRDGLSPIAQWIQAALAGQPLEVRADNPERDWTSVSDLAPALMRLIEGPAPGRPLHLTSGQVWRDRALAEEIASAVRGARVVTTSAGVPLKAPMAPSRIEALAGFAWTDARQELRGLLARAGAA